MCYSSFAFPSFLQFCLEFGEDVVYTPLNGTARTILAVVDRDQGAAEHGPATVPQFRVTACNRTTSKTTDDDGVGGIGSDEINLGGDLATLAKRIGELGIPTIGFGPGEEQFSHSVQDHVPIDHLIRAAAFYAAFPFICSGAITYGSKK